MNKIEQGTSSEPIHVKSMEALDREMRNGFDGLVDRLLKDVPEMRKIDVDKKS